MKNTEDRNIFKLIEKGEYYYNKHKFDKAVIEFEKIAELDVGKNRFKANIDEANLKLGVSYLGTNQIGKACKTFKSIGDITDFRIKNYLINFCKNNIE